MAHYSRSGQAVAPRRNVSGHGRTVAHSARSRAAQRPLSFHRNTSAGADSATRVAAPGDVAQAQTFSRILHDELNQLQRRLNLVSGTQRMSGNERMRDEVRELTLRIAELQRLLGGLQVRFRPSADSAFTVRNGQSALSRN